MAQEAKIIIHYKVLFFAYLAMYLFAWMHRNDNVHIIEAVPSMKTFNRKGKVYMFIYWFRFTTYETA